MTQYESEVKQIAAPVNAVYAKLSNLENLRPFIDNAGNNDALRSQIEAAGYDASALDNLRDVQLTADSIAIPAPMVGQVSMRICEREENKCVKFETEQSPVSGNLWIQVLPSSDGGTRMKLTLRADLNPMIKMMIGGKLKEGINKFADMVDGMFENETPCDGSILTNARQYDAIRRAYEAMLRALQSLKLGVTPDAVLTDVEEAMEAMGEVTGATVREDITARIFERFCVGK